MRYSVESVNVCTASNVSSAVAYRISTTNAGRFTQVLHFDFDSLSSSEPLRLEIVFKIAVEGIHGLWTPFGSSKIGDQATVCWKHELRTAQAGAFPALAFVDRELAPVFLISFMDHASETEWSIGLSQSEECYFVKFSYPDTGYLPRTQWNEIAFYVEEACGHKENIYAAIERFTQFFESKSSNASGKVPAPDSAYLPVFCTWYAAHAAVDRKWAEKSAALAADLGFGQFIQDDGWQHDRFRRVKCVSDLKNWFAWTGDWAPSPKKFPDFADHVAAIQSLGLKYILWWDPYGVGRYSSIYKTLKNHLSAQNWEFEGRRYLCPQDEVVHNHILNTAVRMVSDYGLDGFKVDFIYALDRHICTNDKHQHFASCVSRGVVKTMMEALEAVRKIRPDFNMMHTGGPLWNALSTSLRGVDVPMDADSNLYYLSYFKAFSGGNPLQSDPLFWAKDDSIENAARHLISSVFYVPCLSMDILSMSADRLDLIRRWMAFYRNNLSFFRKSNRRIQNTGPLVTAVSADADDKQVIGVFRNVPVSIQDAGDITILNGSSGSDVYLSSSNARKAELEVYGADFQSVLKSRISMKDITRIDIPGGGYAHLRAC